MYSYTLDGITFKDPVDGIDEFVLTLERTGGSDNLFREYAETSLTFYGSAYCYLCDKLAGDYCAITAIDIYFDGVLVFEGNIVASFGRMNFNKKAYETQITDRTFRGLIAARAKNEVRLDSIVTVSCLDLTPINELMLEYINFDGTIAGDRLSFDVLDVLRFVVSSISDNVVSVQSAYLTNNPYVITTGFNLANTAGLTSFKKYPLVTFEQVYSELRKRFALYASFEIIAGVPTIIFEPENFWFENAAAPYSLADIPFDLEIAVDEDKIFSISKIGNTDVDIDSAFNPFINNKVDGWQEVTFNTCGCIAPLTDNSEQDLTTNWIHDSGQIFEVIQNAKNESKIFILEILPLTGDPAIYPIVPTTNFYYNEKLRNKNIAINWSSIYLNCSYLFRSNDARLFAFNQVVVGDPPNCNLQTFPTQATPISASGGMRYLNVNEDSVNGLALVSNAGAQIGSVGLPCANEKSRYTIQIAGAYSFRASRLFTFQFAIPTGNTLTFDLLFIIRAYDSANNIKSNTSELLQSSFITGQTLWTNTAQVITPLIDLIPGDYVEVSLTFQAQSSGASINVQGLFGDGEFRTNDDLMSCSEVPVEGNRIPYLLEFSTPLCKSEYDLINVNRSRYITLGALKGWLKKLDFDPKGIGTFTLLTDQIICNDTN